MRNRWNEKQIARFKTNHVNIPLNVVDTNTSVKGRDLQLDIKPRYNSALPTKTRFRDKDASRVKVRGQKNRQLPDLQQKNAAWRTPSHGSQQPAPAAVGLHLSGIPVLPGLASSALKNYGFRWCV